MNAKQTKTQTLQEFLADYAICRTWIVSTACPTGQELILDLESDNDDYCDSECLLDQREIRDAADLDGTVTQDRDGEWRWDVDSRQQRR